MKSSATKVGLDTGFFKVLDRGHEEASRIWKKIVAGQTQGVVSCMSLYEVQKLSISGAVDDAAAEALVEELPHLCQIVWLTSTKMLGRAARVAHTYDIATTEALILMSLLEADVETIYTTDVSLKKYDDGPDIFILD